MEALMKKAKDMRSGYREEREHGKTRILKYRYNR
jgi:hypothetical protein